MATVDNPTMRENSNSLLVTQLQRLPLQYTLVLSMFLPIVTWLWFQQLWPVFLVLGLQIAVLVGVGLRLLLLRLRWPRDLFGHNVPSTLDLHMQQPNGRVQAGSDGRATENIKATAGRRKSDIDDIPPVIAGGEYDHFLSDQDQARQVPMPNGQAAQNADHAALALLLALGSAVGLQRQLDSD